MQDQPISWLMFFTLAAGLVIVAFVFLNFIKSRSNREVAEDTLTGNGRSHGAARDGALPELLGLTAVALIAMGLLTIGQNAKPSVETAQLPGPVGSTASEPRANAGSGTTTGANNGVMQQPGSFNQPKNYQPANPAQDSRVAPTGSDTGVGSSPGNTGTPTK
jgi:hypothetical protein